MKSLFCVLFLILVFHYGYAQTIRNSIGSKIYTIKDGIVRDANVRMIGRIEGDGTIRNSKGISLGTFGRGEFRNRTGNLLFKLEGSGILRDRNGRKVNIFSESGVVRDSNGKRIATFEGDPTWQIVAVIIYFWNIT